MLVNNNPLNNLCKNFHLNLKFTTNFYKLKPNGVSIYKKYYFAKIKMKLFTKFK